jgi:hypothetical protein
MIDVTESFNRFGTMVFATKVMSSTITFVDREMEIDAWLEMVPKEYLGDVDDIIISMKPGVLASTDLEDVKAAFIFEIQRKMELKIKSGRKPKHFLPDFG